MVYWGGLQLVAAQNDASFWFFVTVSQKPSSSFSSFLFSSSTSCCGPPITLSSYLLPDTLRASDHLAVSAFLPCRFLRLFLPFGPPPITLVESPLFFLPCWPPPLATLCPRITFSSCGPPINHSTSRTLRASNHPNTSAFSPCGLLFIPWPFFGLS
jgi:hypothetical protein